MLIDGYSSPYKSKVKCEDCGETREVQRTQVVLEKEEHPCRVCSNKRNGKAKAGKYTAWNSGKRYSIRETERTKYIDSHGYVQVWCGRGETSRGRKDGYMAEHRMVMENLIGRELEPGEVVHHVNGVKTENSEDNLFLCESKAKHREIHSQLEKISFELLKRGVIIFDNELGEYVINE